MKSFSFKQRLLVLCFFMATVSILIGVVAFRGLKQVSVAYSEVTQNAMPNLEALNDMYLAYRGVRINLRTLGLKGLPANQKSEYQQQTLKQIADYEDADRVYQSLPFEADQKPLYAELNAAWLHFKEIGKEALALSDEGTPQAEARLNEIFLKDCPDAAKRFTAAVEALKDLHEKFAKTSVQKAESASTSTSAQILLGSAAGIGLGLLVGFLFASATTRVITNVVSNLARTSEKVTTASEDIAQASSSLSEATTQQSASLQETASSLEEITTMIKRASESADSVATSAGLSLQKAEDGRRAAGDMLTSMDEISKSNDQILGQFEESNRQMTEMVRVIKEIAEKTQMINDIVFQTKLLSFNASVEAARAGEHGKGFSVVAEEIGNLARMSGDSAKEIMDLLSESTARVEQTVEVAKHRVADLTSSAKLRVSSGVKVAHQCADVLQEIVASASEVTSLSRDISNATREQALGVSEINKATSQLDTVTQQNSNSSLNAAESAKSLSLDALSLDQSVSELVAVVSGAGAAGERVA